MKIICLKEPSKAYLSISKKKIPTTPISIGSEYTVQAEMIFEGRKYYILSEFVNEEISKAWDARLFGLISDIDEMQLVNQKEELHA